MKKKYANLRLHQMDSTLGKLRDAHLPSPPSIGWVKAIRESLGIGVAPIKPVIVPLLLPE
jgi:hypothetical protein